MSGGALRSRWERAHGRDLVDRIAVETRRQGAGVGPSFAQAVTVLGAARTGRTLARDDAGEEVTAEATIRVPPWVTPVDDAGEPAGPAVDALVLFAVGSKVTAYGRRATVLTVKPVGHRGRLERVDVTTS